MLDESAHHIGAEAKNYTVEYNSTANDVTEQVIKGNIALIKHTDDGETQLETPEVGAEFSVFLKSAGSYDAAEDTERDYDDWKEDLEEQYPELSEDERISLMYELNGDYLDDERHNLNIQLSRPILVVGDLGLWHGRRMGYKEIESGNIRDCLYSERDIDYSTWYVDKNGDFRCDAIHHDGTNHYLYRTYKDGVSEMQIDNLKEKLYRGTATRADITRITRRLGDEIANVYGFPIPHRRQAVTPER